jgi:hypothetical protein
LRPWAAVAIGSRPCAAIAIGSWPCAAVAIRSRPSAAVTVLAGIASDPLDRVDRGSRRLREPLDRDARAGRDMDRLSQQPGRSAHLAAGGTNSRERNAGTVGDHVPTCGGWVGGSCPR